MTSLGLTAAIVGLVGGGITRSRSHRLRWEYTTSQDENEEYRRVQAYNEALRLELGLTRSEVETIERSADGATRPRGSER